MSIARRAILSGRSLILGPGGRRQCISSTWPASRPSLGPVASLQLTRRPLTRREIIEKRIFDLVCAAGALIVVTPFLIFVAIMAVMFQSIFTFAKWPMEVIGDGLTWFGDRVAAMMSPGDLRSLLVDGVITESGTHEDLLQKQHDYWSLYIASRHPMLGPQPVPPRQPVRFSPRASDEGAILPRHEAMPLLGKAGSGDGGRPPRQ